MTLVKAGTSRVDITPQEPIFMGGFGQRYKESEGVHDPLFAKGLFINDGESAILLITTDLLSIPGDMARQVHKRLRDITGLTNHQVMISASHTHSGPALKDFYEVTETIQKYSEFVTQSLIRVGEEAYLSAKPSQLITAEGKVDFLINRRTRGNPNIVDNRVFAMAVMDETTNEKSAVLFGCSCHPVCVGYENYLLSADFPGYAQKYIEEKMSVGNALFFNMAQGNMIPSTRTPTNSMDPRGYNGKDFEAANKIGTLLADKICEILANEPVAETVRVGGLRKDPLIMPNYWLMTKAEAKSLIKEKQKVIEEYLGEEYFQGVSLENLAPLKYLWGDACKMVIENNFSEVDVTQLLGSICQYRIGLACLVRKNIEPINVPIQVLRINEYVFLALPGEVLIEVSFDWQKRTKSDKAFIIALANDSFGYLPHTDNYNEPGADQKYETIMNFLDRSWAEIALKEAEMMATSLGATG